MEEDRLMQSMLLDFYGELLTDKQRECYDLHVNEDLSLSEIAEQSGISRQGVWDNIRRAEAALRQTEEKTGLAARHTKLLQQIGEAEGVLRRIGELNNRQFSSPALLSLCSELQGRLDEMKL